MSPRLRGAFQLVLLVSIAAVLIRFFPVALRVGEVAALGLARFWWLVLILGLGGWLVFVLRKRNSG